MSDGLTTGGRSVPTDQPSTMDASCVYAACGWPVVPVHGKRPAIKGWQDQATTDTEIIAWWLAKWPDAGIGCVTGTRSNLYVVDIDPRNGGFDTFGNLPLPDTFTCNTPSGGLHLHYQSETPILGGTNKLGPGIDVKGVTKDGRPQLVIMPPSPGYVFDSWGAGPLPVNQYPTDIEATQPPGEFPITAAYDPEVRYVFEIEAWASAKYEACICEMASAKPGDRRNTKLNAIAFTLGRLIPFGYVDEQKLSADLVNAALQAGEDIQPSIATIQSGIASGKNKPIELATYRSLKESDGSCKRTSISGSVT